MDPQGNATMSSGVEKNAVEFSILDLLLDEGDLEQCAIASPTGGFDVIPANGDLTAAEVELTPTALTNHPLISGRLLRHQPGYPA